MNIIETIKLIQPFTSTCVLNKDGETFFSPEGMEYFGRIKHDSLSESIGFYDNIPEFLKIVGLFDTPVIEQNGVYLTIKDTNNPGTLSNFLTCDINLINKQQFDFKTQLNKTLEAPNVFKTTLSKEIINKIRIASNVISNCTLTLDVGSKTTCILQDVDVLSGSGTNYKFEIDSELSEKQFKIGFDPSILTKFQNEEIILSVVYSSQSNRYRIILSQNSLVVVLSVQNME